MCLIQIKCIDFNSTQFDAFGVEFDVFNAIQCIFELCQISRFNAFLNCTELMSKGIKLHWIELSSIQYIYTPHKNFSAGKVLTECKALNSRRIALNCVPNVCNWYILLMCKHSCCIRCNWVQFDPIWRESGVNSNLNWQLSNLWPELRRIDVKLCQISSNFIFLLLLLFF